MNVSPCNCASVHVHVQGSGKSLSGYASFQPPNVLVAMAAGVPIAFISVTLLESFFFKGGVT